MISRSHLEIVVETILANPRPVVCPDTNVYLDLINGVLGMEVGYALKNLEELSAKGMIHLVAPEIIIDEFERNIPAVKERAKKETRRLSDEVSSIHRLMVALGKVDEPLEIPGYLDSEAGIQVIEEIGERVARLLSCALRLETTPEVTLLASQRQRNAIRPARRGKDSHGDCLIVETLLQLAGSLRAVGFQERILLVSANTEDFGGGTATTKRNVHPSLELEFLPISVEFFSSVYPALYELTAPKLPKIDMVHK